MKRKTLIAFISACLISFLIGASYIYLVYGQTASTFWITEGVYSGASSYTLWVETPYYFAKDEYGQIDYSGTNATTVINSAFSNAPEGAKFFFLNGKYSIDGVLSPKDLQRIEGEARAKHLDYSTSTIFELTTASATIDLRAVESVHISTITIQGSDIAVGITTGDSVTLKSANYVFTDLYIRNCTYGIFNDDTTGFYDSAFYSVKFYGCGVAVELKELMNNFYQTIFFRNEVAVELGDTTTGFWGMFEGCVWSGNDYDFNVTALNPSITVRNGWFEAEGTYSLGAGNGNLFTNTTAMSNGNLGVIFDRCYFSADTNIDLRWADYGGYAQRTVVFRECNFQGWDSLTQLTPRSSAYLPRFDNSWRMNTTGYKIWLLSENSGETSIADGGTIEHELVYTPTSVVVTTSVSGEFASVTAKGTTTFTVAIKKHDNSAGTTQTIYWYTKYDA